MCWEGAGGCWEGEYRAGEKKVMTGAPGGSTMNEKVEALRLPPPTSATVTAMGTPFEMTEGYAGMRTSRSRSAGEDA